ncbi:mutanase [Stagonosporopsis vannaccii]|nr:mutanase [Stagonosporopsis vannaccii]
MQLLWFSVLLLNLHLSQLLTALTIPRIQHDTSLRSSSLIEGAGEWLHERSPTKPVVPKPKTSQQVAPVQPAKPLQSQKPAPAKPSVTSKPTKSVVASSVPSATMPNLNVVRPTTPVNTCMLPTLVCEDDYDNVGGLEDETNLATRGLEKRGNTRKFDADIGNMVDLTFHSLGYPSSSELFKTRRGTRLPKTVFDFNDKTNLKDILVKDSNKIPTDYTTYVTEHIVEVSSLPLYALPLSKSTQLQTVQMFLLAITGRGQMSLSQTADSVFFQDYWIKEFTVTQVSKRTNKPPIEMGKRKTLNDLVFEALGSSFNRNDFVLCEKEINSYKERLWSRTNPMDKGKLKIYLQDAVSGALPSTYFLSVLRTTLATFNYLEHPTVSRRMQNDVKHVQIELRNIKQLTGKDVTTTTGQVLDMPSLWVEFMNKQLAAVEKFGKDWLNVQLKEADRLYDTHMTSLKQQLAQLQQDDKKIGAAKTKYDSDRKTKTQKLEVELKQKDTAVAKAVKDEAAARKVVKDIEDKIDAEPKQAQKKVIRTKEDLDGKKRLLDGAERVHLEALRARNLKERELHVLWPQAVQALVANVKADQDQLAAYKLAVTKVKLPKAA